MALDMAMLIEESLEDDDSAKEVLVNALLSIPNKLLDNAGYNDEEAAYVRSRLIENPHEVYDIENQLFGDPEELGLYDATKAVSEALRNSIEIAGVLGTLGGIVCHPRDQEFERSEARADSEWAKVSANSDAYQNPALNRK